jgi:deoxyribodipyrimidine photo-lyase
MDFPTSYSAVLARIDQIDPIRYSRNRNFIDGSVTRLSPYISRGFITLPLIRESVLSKGYSRLETEKFLQELCWREYFQRVWWKLGDRINYDIRQVQQAVIHHEMVTAIVEAQTGIRAVDDQIMNLYETGYMHNHARMYVAGIACNLAGSHWKLPAQWMYYHLLDGDIASNFCSWQWVAGSFSHKKYIANQQNINKYLFSNQTDTYLDKSYETIFQQDVPAVLKGTQLLDLHTTLPEKSKLQFDRERPLFLYHSYHLDPMWRKDEYANRVLLLDPDHFKQYPVCDKVIRFILDLANNIAGIKVFTGNMNDLLEQYGNHSNVFTVEHPLMSGYNINKDPYPWMVRDIEVLPDSFFSFWKKVNRCM